MTAGTTIILGLGSAFALALFCLGFAYPSGRFITLWSEIPQTERVRYQLYRPRPTVDPSRWRWGPLMVYLAAHWINSAQAKRILPPAVHHSLRVAEICLVSVLITVFILHGVVWSWRVLRGAAGERGPQMRKVANVLLVVSLLGLSAWVYLIGGVVLGVF